MSGIVFDIQNYAIYDGPGIRTIVFLKGCPLKCDWCQNPESQQLSPEISYFKEKCQLCEICIQSCPNSALQLINDGIIRDKTLCTVCGICAEKCPNNVMEIIGWKATVEELVDKVLLDKPFYDNSGGGATFSGGEPTVQINFLLKLLKALKKENIHTAIETCGYFNGEKIDDLVKFVDLFLFDIKMIDRHKHRDFTGVNNNKILANFTKILSIVGNKRIIPRIPLIPGVNTDLTTIQRIIGFLKRVHYDGHIHLMPYNKLTKTKYEKVGKGDLYKDLGELTDDNLNLITELFEEHSYEVIVNH
jgi:pyruvate formate lyase activating enzyme